MATYRRFFNNDYKYVFITMITNNRIPILLDHIALLRSSFKYAMNKYIFEIYSVVIMNDHIHLILKLNNNRNYPEIIRLIKYYFSIHIKKCGHAYALPTLQLSESKIKKREKGIWQRRYWEHTIRDENDLHRHIDYIHYNPVKHYNIAPKDWEFSSFNKFVELGFYEKDWYNLDDKYKINDLGADYGE